MDSQHRQPVWTSWWHFLALLYVLIYILILVYKWDKTMPTVSFIISTFFFFFFLLFRAVPVAYRSFQFGGQIRAPAAGLCHCNAGSNLRLQPTPQLNAGSLTHWARPGIKPAASWILVRFVSTAPQWELLFYHIHF